ncbi:protein MIZU-KUSSEI 1 [Rutidosis leptorrhynchoides]|uniref:protein MIZU-KUSSEI 1 n=1 Tax=Rutidosis leptorrhynchoides TaxID=125765 RepID=UPI003A99D610
MKHDVLLSLSRNSSSKIIPSNYITNPSFIIDSESKPLVENSSSSPFRIRLGFTSFIRSFLTIISIPTFQWPSLPSLHLALTPSLGRKVTGTLFGNRRGHVSFSVQHDPRSAPLLIIDMAMSTSALVKEMSSGLVRIALECEKTKKYSRGSDHNKKLLNEPTWSMYCNGRKCGNALTRVCTESDWHVLSTVKSVSVGAGVIPVVEDGGCGSEGELLYMRAKYERVVGSRDSEAYYMMNPDGNGGPELSIFLLRI